MKHNYVQMCEHKLVINTLFVSINKQCMTRSILNLMTYDAVALKSAQRKHLVEFNGSYGTCNTGKLIFNKDLC